MATAVSLFADARGYLHSNAESADSADEAFELAERRQVVLGLLVKEMLFHPAPVGMDSPSARRALADWLVEHWPTMRAVGFAYRVHELGAAGDSTVTVTGEQGQ